MLSILTAVSMAQNHRDWQQVLDNYRSETARVHYEKIARDNATDRYIHALATHTEPTEKHEQLAFWINAYNAITVKLVADHWPIGSIKEIDNGQVWDRRTFTVANQQLTLNEIERKKLLPLGDPRVHVALNCASLGCPPLYKEAFLAKTIEQQLHDATTSWVASTAIQTDTANQQLQMSMIFDWYAADFDVSDERTLSGVKSKLQGPVKWVSQYTSPSQRDWLLKGNYTISFLPYSWAINSPD